jgi:hypothetical protein
MGVKQLAWPEEAAECLTPQNLDRDDALEVPVLMGGFPWEVQETLQLLPLNPDLQFAAERTAL